MLGLSPADQVAIEGHDKNLERVDELDKKLRIIELRVQLIQRRERELSKPVVHLR